MELRSGRWQQLTINLTSGSILFNGILTNNATGNVAIATTLSGTGSITNTAGNLTLSGSNTHTGVTTLRGGVLSVSTIGNGGVAGNLGQAGGAAANLVFENGVLEYTGLTASTDWLG